MTTSGWTLLGFGDDMTFFPALPLGQIFYPCFFILCVHPCPLEWILLSCDPGPFVVSPRHHFHSPLLFSYPGLRSAMAELFCLFVFLCVCLWWNSSICETENCENISKIVRICNSSCPTIKFFFVHTLCCAESVWMLLAGVFLPLC